MTAHLKRRIGPVVVSLVYVVLGLAYCFRWGPVAQHVPSLWLIPKDLPHTYYAAAALAHGHFSEIYQPAVAFLSYPGILIVLAPLGALSGVFSGSIVEIGVDHHLLAHPRVFPISNASSLLLAKSPGFSDGREYVLHATVFEALIPVALLLACTSLFAFDALAERLQVSRERRIVLSVLEAVLLWNVTVPWGHPEDAVAVALATYALVFAIDRRFTGAGWLFGAAVATQPLVLLVAPVLLVMAGRRHGVGLAIRSVLPSAVLLAVPLVASFRTTVHALVLQPSYPNIDHATPWTALAPHISGHGAALTVASGPGRIVAFVVAIGLGIWVVGRRWLVHPERLALACAVALALRSYTESVMAAYYPWTALAVGLVVAARCTRLRFAIAGALAIGTTIVANFKIAWLPWWAIEMAGMTALLVAAARPQPIEPASQRVRPARVRAATTTRGRSPSASSKRDAPGQSRSSASAPGRSGSEPAKKKGRSTSTGSTRSGRR